MIDSNKQFIAAAAFANGELVGYAVRRVPQTWYCVHSSGLGWENVICEKSADVFLAFQRTAGAYIIRRYTSIRELDQVLKEIPEDQETPPIPDGGVATLREAPGFVVAGSHGFPLLPSPRKPVRPVSPLALAGAN